MADIAELQKLADDNFSYPKILGSGATLWGESYSPVAIGKVVHEMLRIIADQQRRITELEAKSQPAAGIGSAPIYTFSQVEQAMRKVMPSPIHDPNGPVKRGKV